MKHIVIIGTGIVGLVTARKLVQSGFKVSLLGEGTAASYCAPGINCIKGIFLGDDELFRKKISGHYRLWNELNQLQKCTELNLELKNGIIEPFIDSRDYMARSQRAFHGRFLGLYNALLYGTGEPFIVENLHPKYQGLIYHPDDYSYNPAKVLEALLQNFLHSGGQVITKRVERIYSANSGFRVSLSDQTEIQSDDLVLAAGAGSASILERSGFNIPQFKFKAGVALKGSSHLSLVFKLGALSGVAREGELRFGAIDFNVDLHTDQLQISKLQKSHEIFADDEDYFDPHINKLTQTLNQITHGYTNPKFVAGVRINGWGRKPVTARLQISDKRSPVLVTGFHKSGWSLAWEASDQVKTLIENT